jgi:hypothetical protein
MEKEIDDVVRRSLTAFCDDVLDGSWSGRREREAVSLYSFGFLQREVREDGFLRDPTQIAIECAVPQLDGEAARAISGRSGSKEQVCKDLVLWPEPRMTCWDQESRPRVAPSAILEWKFGRDGVSRRDVQWLSSYCDKFPDFIGYAVTANQPGRGFRLSCSRIRIGRVEPKWIHRI